MPYGRRSMNRRRRSGRSRRSGIRSIVGRRHLGGPVHNHPHRAVTMAQPRSGTGGLGPTGAQHNLGAYGDMTKFDSNSPYNTDPGGGTCCCPPNCWTRSLTCCGSRPLE